MEDNYYHIDDTLIYVLENIPGPTEHTKEHDVLLDSFNTQLLNQCACTEVCVPSTCCCKKLSGGNNYTMCQKISKLKLNKDKIKNRLISPIIECNDMCQCSENCSNRLVQKGPCKSLYIKTCSNDKGLGLFTNDLIAIHTFVCEYAGEVITSTQAEIRHKENIKNNKMNYIFCLNEHSDNAKTQTLVDPSKFGNIGRYANHSCDPNCVIVPVRVNSPIPKLALFSCRDILPNSEITFNYGSNFAINRLPFNGEKTKCLCNTNKCMGWMPYQMH